MDESVGSEVGSAIDVVDGVESLQILVELLIASIFSVGSLLCQRDNCPNHLTLFLTEQLLDFHFRFGELRQGDLSLSRTSRSLLDIFWFSVLSDEQLTLPYSVSYPSLRIPGF